MSHHFIARQLVHEIHEFLVRTLPMAQVEGLVLQLREVANSPQVTPPPNATPAPEPAPETTAAV